MKMEIIRLEGREMTVLTEPRPDAPVSKVLPVGTKFFTIYWVFHYDTDERCWSMVIDGKTKSFIGWLQGGIWRLWPEAKQK